MALSKSAQDELAQEAQSLRNDIEKHQAQIDAAQTRLNAIYELIGTRRKRQPEGEIVVLSDMNFEGKGFRDVVREALLDCPTGIRPFELADYLRGNGYKPGGDTDLTTRVGNELNRLKKKGDAKKIGKEYFPTPALEKKS